MTQDEIIRMAREADVPFETETDGSLYGMIGRMCNEDFFKFAVLVAVHEREACAKLAETWDFNAQSLIKAIRARGEK